MPSTPSLTARDLGRFSAVLENAADSWNLFDEAGHAPDPLPRDVLDRHAFMAGYMAKAADVLERATDPRTSVTPIPIHTCIKEAADRVACGAGRLRRAAEAAQTAPSEDASGKRAWRAQILLDHATGRDDLHRAAQCITTAAQHIKDAEELTARLASRHPRPAPAASHTSEPPPPPPSPTTASRPRR
jgi:hypothetical protein